MRFRVLGNLAVTAAIAAAVGVPLTAGTAQAESCVTLPGTTGATIEALGQQIRVPSTSGVGVCVEPGGGPGLPRVETGGTATSVVLGAGSSASGYVAVRYTLDGNPNEVRVPIPGGGPGVETCLASVGTPARSDCLVKVSVDELPTLPPTPTIPPVSPEPLPTPPPTPEPDPFCHRSTCIPYGGSVLQEPYDALLDLVQQIPDRIREIVEDFFASFCFDPDNPFVTCA